VRLGERNPSLPEDVDVKLECTAHHEAGHVVVAAAQQLRLRLDGLSVDSRGEGLACYCKQPDESDPSRERVIIATFAGYKAQERFCEECSYPAPDALQVILSPDWCEARETLTRLSDEYFANETVATIQCKLESRSEHLVGRSGLSSRHLPLPC
jgi:hypothetical protein